MYSNSIILIIGLWTVSFLHWDDPNKMEERKGDFFFFFFRPETPGVTKELVTSSLVTKELEYYCNCYYYITCA